MRDFIFIAALAALIYCIVRICMRKKGRYEVAEITCMCCGHHWVGVYPVGTDIQKFECPECHAQDSECEEIDMRPFLLDEKEEEDENKCKAVYCASNKDGKCRRKEVQMNEDGVCINRIVKYKCGECRHFGDIKCPRERVRIKNDAEDEASVSCFEPKCEEEIK